MRVCPRARWATLVLPVLAAVLVTCVPGAGAAAPRPGTLDRGFGVGGRVVTDFGTEPTPRATAQQATATVGGGLLVLSGSSWSPGSYSISRYRSDGTVDRGFGNDGAIVRVDWPIAMVTDSRGRIIVLSSPTAPPESRFEIIPRTVTLERFEPDGTLDRSFGDGGSAETEDKVPDGFYLERLGPDGSPDPSFGGGRGYVTRTVDLPPGSEGESRVDGMALLPGAATLLFGYAPAPGGGIHSLPAMAMFGPGGEPVESFGSDGVLFSRPPSMSRDVGYGLLASRDGVTVSGRAAGKVLLRRYRPDGSPDRSFRDGRSTLPPDGSYLGATGSALAAAPGGGFFLGSGSSSGGEILRFGEGGGLRSGYGVGGEARAGALLRITGLAPTDDGSLYAIGFSKPGCALELAHLRPDGSPDQAFGDDEGSFRIATFAGACGYRHIRLGLGRGGGVIVAGQASGRILRAYGPRGQRRPLSKPFAGSWSQSLQAIAVDAKGDLVLAGRVESSLAVMRVSPSGRLDRSFGRDGLVRLAVGRYAEASSLALEPDGGVVVAGRAYLCVGGSACHGSSALVARIGPDGRLDRAFGSEGVWTARPGEESALEAVAIAPGAIYATGSVTRPHSGLDLLLVKLHR